MFVEYLQHYFLPMQTLWERQMKLTWKINEKIVFDVFEKHKNHNILKIKEHHGDIHKLDFSTCYCILC